MKCPNCNETLLMADKHGIEVDYCPNCRGIWLDKGELEKIMERTADHYAQRDNYESDYKKYKYNEYDHKKSYNPNYPHKKKSFLNDIFDF